MTSNSRIALADGVLAFPLTPFDASGDIDLERFSQHLEELLSHRPGAIFTACGTGEFAALTSSEHRALVVRTVEIVAGRVSVFAGIGINAAIAAEQAAAAAAAGADGVLLLPPYLHTGPQAGLEAYVRTVVGASPLPLILYQRATAVYDPGTVRRLSSLPEVVGLKDGIGDLERVQRTRIAVGDELMFFNGLPTAELQAEPFRAVGVPRYSSAVFSMAPEIAACFYHAFSASDAGTMQRLLNEFYGPLADLRDQVPGYAVTLIKAGAALRGSSLGRVRAPLPDPTSEHLDTLAALIERGTAIANGAR